MSEDLLAPNFVSLLVKGKLWLPDEFLIGVSFAPLFLFFVHPYENCFCEAHFSI